MIEAAANAEKHRTSRWLQLFLNMKNLIIRSMSGAVYVALIVCSILFGYGIAFPLLASLFAFIGIMEFQKMTLEDFYESPRMLLVDLLVGIMIPFAAGIGGIGLVIEASILWMLVFVLILMRFVMQLYSHRKNPVRHIGMSVMSIVYISIPLATAAWLGSVVPGLLLLVFVMIWLNDTGAFIVGSAIGSHRLFERLSPKKSWEGFFGGFACCVAAGFCAKSLFPVEFASMSGNMLGFMGAVVSVMATWGDLFESMIKRTAGVKDSGTVIPGHGGVLDRIDSLLFVAPAIWIMILIFSFMSNFELIKGA